MITTRTRAHGRRTAIATAVTVLALISAGCSAPAKDPPTMPPAPAASTGVSTGASTPAPGSGLKSIDQGALQALVDATIKEQLIPGAVFVLDTPQGDFTAASGTTERGVDRPPDARDPLPDRLEPKTMTSAVVLQLAQEGKLGLQDPVPKYVSGVPGGENITVAELLKMRSGLYNHTNSPVMATSIDDDPTKAWTPQELLDIAFAQPANFAPDAEFEYSNTNYALLGLVIERVDGKPLATAFHDRLFEPLGMLNTELPVGTSNSIPEPYSHGYLYGSSSVALFGTPEYTPEQIAGAKDGSFQPTDYTDVNHSFAYAAGGVISTANDLARWMNALVGGKVFDAQYQKIWLDSVQLEDPGNPAGQWYGYGIARQSWGPNTLLLHGGETAGCNSAMVVETTNDVTLVVWTNLTVDVDSMRQTANSLMLKVLDQIYVQSPLARVSASSAAATPNG